MTERFLLLERAGNGRGKSSLFELRLRGKKLHVRHGAKGQKLQSKQYKKNSFAEASAMFSEKRQQKLNSGYRIIKQTPNDSGSKDSTPNIPNVSCTSIPNPNKPEPPLNPPKQSNRHKKKNKQVAPHKQKQKTPRGRAQANKKPIPSPPLSTTSTSASSHSSHSTNQENNSQTANGSTSLSHYPPLPTPNGSSYASQAPSQIEQSIMASEPDDNVSDSHPSQSSHASHASNPSQTPSSKHSNSSKQSSNNSSVQSGRSSDHDYEMDYEKMSHVMHRSLNKQIDPNTLDWQPLKLWIRFDEFHDRNAQYALAPQLKRIAGSCHELLVIYLRSDSRINERGVVLKRLLKLARDPEEDNRHHFDTERRVAQYLSKMARLANFNIVSRTDVCIWPVETVQLEYKGEMKWATLQAPFLPDPKTNNIFVKIEPNSGKPCVQDAVVGRYQHLFAAITKGLDLIRDWQGYGVSQSVFLDVCERFRVEREGVEQVRKRGGRKGGWKRIETQVLVVIDPVLTTCGAHYETNNPTDFGVKAIDEWKMNHDCARCRCKYMHLKGVDDEEDGMQFGVADVDQMFFDRRGMREELWQAIRRCRYELGIWCGDEYFADFEAESDEDEQDEEEDVE